MESCEATPLLSSKPRRSSRLTGKEKPSNSDPVPEAAVLTEQGFPLKDNSPPKKASGNSSKKMKHPVEGGTDIGPNPKKKKSSSKKKHTLDTSHRKPILQGMISEELAEDNETDPLPISVKSSKTKVKETLRAFTSHYLHCVQEEQRRAQSIEASLAQKKINKKAANDKEDEKLKRPSRRPDLKAISKMLEEETVLNPIKRLGHIPGVEVGDHFFSRAELVVLGIHSHWLKGIDYMTKEYKKVYHEYTFPLATCIVMSGQYEDDHDNADEITYTGQGGNDLLGNKKQIRDQKLEHGNLALKNNCENNVPVRVVRGYKKENSYTGKIYSYDGLYMVRECLTEMGSENFLVYKYKLQRLEGQKPLTSSQVRFMREVVPRSTANLRGIVSEDISNGLEKFRIPATNTVDNPPYPPSGFVYTNELKIPSDIKMPKNEAGCKCQGDCENSSRDCPCAKLNGNDFAYVSLDGGRLMGAKPIVFECGASCRCGPHCINRTSAKGIRYHLEVFKTPTKGWAVRSWDMIPAGAPVCEYTGILKRTNEVESNRFDNKYLFDIDCLQTMKGLDGREKRVGDIPLLGPCSESETSETPEYCIDAAEVGNVARFINHSCAPNLFVQCVLSSHHDIKLAKIMLFAADNIPPLQELSYDYGFELNGVEGPDGKVIELACYCGAAECGGRLH